MPHGDSITVFAYPFQSSPSRTYCQSAPLPGIMSVLRSNQKLRTEAIMKYVFQFGIILAVSLAGEALRAVIPLPIPASIYGLLLMLLCLSLRVIRLDQVESAGELLLKFLPLLFVPAVVGLMDSWDVLSSMLLPVAAAVLIVTPLVMASSGLAAQAVLRREKKQ